MLKQICIGRMYEHDNYGKEEGKGIPIKLKPIIIYYLDGRLTGYITKTQKDRTISCPSV